MSEKTEIVNDAAAEETPKATEPAAEGKCEGAEGEEKLDKQEKKKLKKAEAELADAQKKAEKLEEALAEEKDKYLRMIAEYDNFRRRTAKEKEGIYADAYSDAVKNLLPILDNLERAALYRDAESVSKGIEMTLKGATDAFNKMGIVAIGAPGEKFDPNLHNAVMHIEDEQYDAETIVEVFQKGYVKDGKVIRPAMVKVAN